MSARDPHRAPVIIVGAGPAGLAVRACLQHHDVEAVVLERAPHVASSWRRHYDALRLHTTRRQSALPHLPFPRTADLHPVRDEVIAYLDAYAARFAPDVRLGCAVRGFEAGPVGWSVDTDACRFEAQHLVLACGAHAVPRPAWADTSTFRGEVLHASAFTSGSRWRGQRALVVGAGNSGADIAVDLAGHGAETTLSLRGPVFAVPLSVCGVHWRTLYALIPNLFVAGARRLRAAPAARRAAARWWTAIQQRAFGDLATHGLRLATADEVVAHWQALRAPLTSPALAAAVRNQRVRLRGETVALDAHGAVFSDGSRLQCDVVVFATGLGPSPLLEAAHGPRAPGEQLVDGAVPGKPGLWICGTRPELSQIGRQARRIASQIAAKMART